MENIEESNLPLPEDKAEAQTSNELSAEELEAVAGGNAILERTVDVIGGIVDNVGGAIKGK